MRRFNVEMRHEQDDHNVWHTELEEIECDGGKYMDAERVLILVREAWLDGARHISGFMKDTDKRTVEQAIGDFLTSKGIEP